MTKDQLQEVTLRTMQEIYKLKKQLEEATDPREKARLEHRLKELRILQLWHLDQLEGME